MHKQEIVLIKGSKLLKKVFFLYLLSFYGCSSEYYYYQNGKKVFLKPSLKATKNLANSQSNIHYYDTENNISLGVTNEILITTKSEVLNIDDLIERYQLTLLKKISSNIYLLEVSNESELFSTVNELYQEDKIQYAHPNFIKNIQKR